MKHWIWVHQGKYMTSQSVLNSTYEFLMHAPFNVTFCIKICMTKYNKYISIISLYMGEHFTLAKRLSFKIKTNYIKYHYNLNAHTFLKGMYNFTFVGFKFSNLSNLSFLFFFSFFKLEGWGNRVGELPSIILLTYLFFPFF